MAGYRSGGMFLPRSILAAPLVVVLLALIPLSAATPPVQGVVTTCSSTMDCKFVFNTTAGAGWATAAPPTLSFQLPGESLASYNLSYTTYIERLTGTYTYWTIGNFLGTDRNTGKVVLGTTDTNYTITAHCTRGCSYTYTTDNGTIVFRFTQAEQTSTVVSCSPAAIKVSGKTTCSVTVTNLWNSSNVPTGSVRLSSGGLGAFANHGRCTLVSGTCSLSWHPFDNTGGYVRISATYAGSAAYYRSAGGTLVTVTRGG